MAVDLSGIFVVSDVDGTFLNMDGRMVERNVRAVERFKSEGGVFTFATGRFKDTLGDVVPDYTRFMNAPGIFCNGAYIWDPATRKLLAEKTFDGRGCIAMLRRLDRLFPDFRIRFTRPDGVFFIEDKPDRELELDGWYKIVIMGDPEQLDEARGIIEADAPGRYIAAKSCPSLLELTGSDGGKGAMLKLLKKHFEDHGRRGTFYAIGDYENDLGLLGAADAAVCPENAVPAVKALCRMRVCGCDGGAVGELIERLEIQAAHPEQ